MSHTAAGPAITICISTKNRAWMLDDMFQALAAQDIDVPFDVSITDDGSTDDTPAVLQRLGETMPFEVKIHRNEESKGPATGRNTAAAHTTAVMLAFTDDDCRPEPGWLRAGLGAMQERRAVVVGRVMPPIGATLGHPMGRVVRSHHWRFFTTSNVFYRADDFAAADGFDPRFPTAGGEDADLGWRVCKAGAEPRYEPTAVVRHPVREPSVRLALREARRWYGIPRFVKKHPEQRELFLTHRVFWRASHQWMVLALASLAATWFSRIALIGVVPWLWTRVLRARSRRARLQNLQHAPVLALIDILEIGSQIRGSVRDRTFTL
jgi:glycosyltransferase involved in cell wall biosynthesis